MRLIRPATDACDRAREQLSLRLDGPLPELDDLRLEAHLASCDACRATGAELESVTSVLRLAPLEQPSVSVVLPRRRLVSVRTLQAGAAAAAIALVASLSTVQGLSNRQASGVQLSPFASLGHDDELVPQQHARTVPRQHRHVAV